MRRLRGRQPVRVAGRHTFWEGIQKQTETAGEDGGKLGLANSTGWSYYLGTFTWGFGWLPSLLALGGIGGLVARHRRLAIVLAPAPILLFLYLGEQSRFFARWMLPIYPILAILAGWALVALVSRVRLRSCCRSPSALALAQGLVFSVHNDFVLARDDTRQVARDWMVENIPAADEDRRRADRARPVGVRRRQAAVRVHGQRQPLEQVPDVALVLLQRRAAPVPVPRRQARGLRAHDRPGRVAAYEEGGFCWVVTGSNQFGRAYAEPEEVPEAIRYYDELRKRGDVVFRVSPYGRDASACRSRSTTRSTTTR